jgi:tricorn protease
LAIGSILCPITNVSKISIHCLPTGEDLQRRTWHREYYACFPSTDGRRIIYHAGADLYLFDPAMNESRKIKIELHSPRTQRKRRFVDPARFLQSVALHPEGHSLVAVVRGKPFTYGNVAARRPWRDALSPG